MMMMMMMMKTAIFFSLQLSAKLRVRMAVPATHLTTVPAHLATAVPSARPVSRPWPLRACIVLVVHVFVIQAN